MKASLKMNAQQFGQILHDIAKKDIPDQPHGWSRVSAGMSVQASHDERRLIVLRKLTVALLIAIMVLFAGTAVYAFYQQVIKTYWLQAILEEKMQTDLHLEQTLEITLTPTPLPVQLHAVTPGVTATLTADEPLTESAVFPIGPISTSLMPTATLTAVVNWAYLDPSRVVISYTLGGDPEVLGQCFFRPELTTMQGEAFGTGGMSLSLQGIVSGVMPRLVSFDHDEQFRDGESVELRLKLKCREEPITNWMDPPLMEFVFDLPLVMQGEAFYIEPNLSTVANGVTMTLQSVKIAPTMVYLHLCYELFDDTDWQFADTTLYIGDYEGVYNGSGFLGDKRDLGLLMSSGQGTLCREARYSIGLGRDEVPETLHFTMGCLKTMWPSSPGPDVLERAHRRLAEKGIEVDFDFSGRGMRFEILKQPEGMQTQEVNTLVFDSLSERYEGPWIFEVDLSAVEPAP